MSRDDHVINAYRACGAMLRRGVGVRVPPLPRSKRSLTVLRLEANRDADVRLASIKSPAARQPRPSHDSSGRGFFAAPAGRSSRSDEIGRASVGGAGNPAAPQKGEVKTAGRKSFCSAQRL